MTGNRSIPLFVRGLTLLAAIIVLGVFSASAQAPEKIKPGDKFEKAINGGQTLYLAFDMKRGRFARFEIEPINFDLKIAVLDARGTTIAEANGNSAFSWKFPVYFIADNDGTYKLRVEAIGPAAFSETIGVKFDESRKQRPEDLKKIELQRDFLQAVKLADENKFAEAAAIFEPMITAWESLGDAGWAAMARWNLAWVFHFSGKRPEAIELHTKALAAVREQGDRLGEAAVINGLGMTKFALGQTAEARKDLEATVAIRREMGRLRREYNTLNILHIIYNDLADKEKLVESMLRSLELSRLLRSRADERDMLNKLGLYSTLMGQKPVGRKYLESAFAIDTELNDIPGQIERIMYLADLQDASATEQDMKLMQKALQLSRVSNDKRNEVKALEALGYYYRLKLEDCRASMDYFEQAYDILRKMPQKKASDEIRILQRLNMASICMADNAGTRKYAELGYEQAKAADQPIDQVIFLQNIAIALGNMGEIEKAKEKNNTALTLAREKKLLRQEATTLFSIANLSLGIDDLEEERELEERGLDIARALKDPPLINLFLGALGNTYTHLGEDEKALKVYEEMMTDAKAAADNKRIADVHHRIGLFYFRKKDHDKALEHYNEALRLSRAGGWQIQSIYIQSSIGHLFSDLGKFDKAIEYFEKVHREAEAARVSHHAGSALFMLGNTHVRMNDLPKALGLFERALANARTNRNRNDEGLNLFSIGDVYFRQTQYEKALGYFKQAEEVSKQTQSKWLNGITAIGFGAVDADLSQNNRAQENYARSLDMLRSVKDKAGEGNVLNAIGNTYVNLKQYDKAREYFQRSLDIAKQANNKNGEVYPLNGLGWVYLHTNELDKARGSFEAAIEKAKAVNDRGNEARVLKGLGDLYLKKKDYAAAEDHLTRSLAMARQNGDRKLEAPVLQAMMELYRDTRKPVQAVFYGKLAINIYQSVRENIKGLDKASQQSYVADKEAAYRTLAGILISQGKLFAAQQVLGLLKEAEYASPTRGGDGNVLEYSGTEAEIAQNIEDLVKLEREFGELSVMNKRDNTQAKRFADLQKILGDTKADILKKFETLVKAEPVVKRSVDDFVLGIGQANIQSALTTYRRKTKAGVAALYTVLANDESVISKDPRGGKTKFGYVILVTEQGAKEYPIDVTNLNDLVFTLHEGLADSTRDPRPVAGKIYDAIFRQKKTANSRTLEQDLNAHLGRFPNKALMWSLDGVLRYIPMAVLHDGRNYLVERYYSSVLTNTNIAGLTTDNSGEWKMLGLGVSEARDGFEAIPEVKTELETIVGDGVRAGILQGMIRLNGDFRKQEFAPLVSNVEAPYPIVHIASHYSFNPADPGRSFLLVGDGRITFDEMKRSGNIFSGVDILTLSACDTGVTENGKETEGLSYKAQEFGARSVIASLWKVPDKGTSELMIRFYRMLAENPGMSKGEAFRKAQLALLGSEGITGPGADASRGVKPVRAADTIDLPLFVKDENRPFAHPHYWASFVLIGNWR